MARRESREITLRARRPVLSPLGRAIGWLAFPWFVAVTVGASIAPLLLLRGEVPLTPFRIVVLLLAVAPAAVWITARMGRLRGSSLFLPADQQPQIHFDERGLVVIMNNMRTAFSWDEIGSLDAAPRWFASRMLRDRDGEPILALPESLAAGLVESVNATAAECVVAVRSDLFQLEYNAALGLPMGFSRRA